ncbi:MULTISPECIES: metal-dependent transcriptional regulator [Vagococcus]|uniref:Manganese transport regulator n=1 Tax=Vagococcus fluvialis bH819 TaxID=1255619 RepID=A0A1X6WJX4_9ENTE|nr:MULTISPECIES: metal-dependent transcriptional regulator [Vagococcus]SLM84601.1 Mn-dependent transcriptional regulator MntR [Vagococcus fluvialis bH819]HCM89935.1 metal-dependent transcriptional regulator [Vagococcus sp.]
MKTSSSNKEDYLKAIYENNGIHEFVANKTLSTHLGVSPASVTEMVEKLQNDGLIEYKPYTGVKLTQEGLNQTVLIIRNHRIIETFLYEKLGYSLHDLHHLSEELEHVKDSVFFSKLYEFLGEPETCPHGGIIPTEDSFIEKAVKPISSFTVGDSPMICRVMDDANILNYMSTINLNIRDIIHIIEIDEFNELIIFTINDDSSTHHISFKQAQIIFSY